MLNSRPVATRLAIFTAALALASCSPTGPAKPTNMIMTPTMTITVTPTTGTAAATVPFAVTPTDTRQSSPQPVTSADLATLSHSNSAAVTAIARTPQPIPLLSPLPNESGIVPGQTETEVQAVLGQPQSKGRYRDMDVWKYQSSKVPTLLEVSFANGRVSEITLQAPGLTAERVVAQYGAPEVVLFYPQVTVPTPEPPAASPRGELVYPSKGVQFEFVCWPTRTPPCAGVPRDVDISVKFYFRPTTIGDWVGRQVLPPGRAELRGWVGFSN